MDAGTRQWVVDSIEEGVAAVHQDGRLVHVPAWILPAGTREGDVLTIEHAPAADGASSLRIAIDRAATEAALRRSVEQVERQLPRDPGGDIIL